MASGLRKKHTPGTELYSPTDLTSHDDITYQSIAKAFDLPLKLHQETYDKMKLLSKPRANQPDFDWDVDSPARRAKLRMAELPTDESRDLKQQFLFPHEDLWVPVAVVNGNVHILPGIPRLCEWTLITFRLYITDGTTNSHTAS